LWRRGWEGGERGFSERDEVWCVCEVSWDGEFILRSTLIIWYRPEDSVKDDVKTLRDSPFFKGMQILGYVQDTETGLLSEVVGLE